MLYGHGQLRGNGSPGAKECDDLFEHGYSFIESCRYPHKVVRGLQNKIFDLWIRMCFPVANFCKADIVSF